MLTHNMAAGDKECIAYFTHAINVEKRSECSSVTIDNLKIYLSGAPPSIKKFFNGAYNGDLLLFFKKYPESFQVVDENRIFLTADVMKLHNQSSLEQLAINYFSEKLKSMNAYQNQAVPLNFLRTCVNDAPYGIFSLFSRRYAGKDFKQFFLSHPEVFTVSNSGNVYLTKQEDDPFPDSIVSSLQHQEGLMHMDMSPDEKAAVDFYKGLLCSPEVASQTCSTDSLFAYLCLAPDNVQRYLKKNYNEYNFLDFFAAHPAIFKTTHAGTASLASGLQAAPKSGDFPPLSGESGGKFQGGDGPKPAYKIDSFSNTVAIWDTPPVTSNQVSDNSLSQEQTAIAFFKDIIQQHKRKNQRIHLDQLREYLRQGPLFLVSYFLDKYPCNMFSRFFLQNSCDFKLDSSGFVDVVEEVTPPVNNTTAETYSQSTIEGEEDWTPEVNHQESQYSVISRNIDVENRIDKFYFDLLVLLSSFGVRVASPENLANVADTMPPRLSAYLRETYQNNLTMFFSNYAVHFRISKSGNICLAVEREGTSEAHSRKIPIAQAVDFFTSILHFLQSHQTSAVHPDHLWNFVSLSPVKISGFISQRYQKSNFREFFTKFPNTFTISKNKNIYLASHSAQKLDIHDDEHGLSYVFNSVDIHESSALEYFIHTIRSTRPNTCPVPIHVLQELLGKASPHVKEYFDDHYPDSKFTDFFLHYPDIFQVSRLIGAVWLLTNSADDSFDDSCSEAAAGPLMTSTLLLKHIIGIVASDLLLKSPRPLSTILGHLSNMVPQLPQELNSCAGKSRTEKLASLLNCCFGVFHVVKENVILSWPAKLESVLENCIEISLTSLCADIIGDDNISTITLQSKLKTKTGRMFNFLVHDLKALVEFLQRNSKFYFTSSETLILHCDPLEDQVEEILCLAKKELISHPEGLPLGALLSNIRGHAYQSSYSCGAVTSVILKYSDWFLLENNKVLLKRVEEYDWETKSDNESVDSEHSSSMSPSNTWQGSGWIRSSTKNEGIIAAILPGDKDGITDVYYKSETFRKIMQGKGIQVHKALKIGDEVEFTAEQNTLNDVSAKWVAVEVSVKPDSNVLKPRKEKATHNCVERQVAERNIRGFASSEDDTEDDMPSDMEDIFYSSSSDTSEARQTNEPREDLQSLDKVLELSCKETNVLDADMEPNNPIPIVELPDDKVALPEVRRKESFIEEVNSSEDTKSEYSFASLSESECTVIHHSNQSSSELGSPSDENLKESAKEVKRWYRSSKRHLCHSFSSECRDSPKRELQSLSPNNSQDSNMVTNSCIKNVVTLEDSKLQDLFPNKEPTSGHFSEGLENLNYENEKKKLTEKRSSGALCDKAESSPTIENVLYSTEKAFSDYMASAKSRTCAELAEPLCKTTHQSLEFTEKDLSDVESCEREISKMPWSTAMWPNASVCTVETSAPSVNKLDSCKSAVDQVKEKNDEATDFIPESVSTSLDDECRPFTLNEEKFHIDSLKGNRKHLNLEAPPFEMKFTGNSYQASVLNAARTVSGSSGSPESIAQASSDAGTSCSVSPMPPKDDGSPDWANDALDEQHEECLPILQENGFCNLLPVEGYSSQYLSCFVLGKVMFVSESMGILKGKVTSGKRRSSKSSVVTVLFTDEEIKKSIGSVKLGDRLVALAFQPYPESSLLEAVSIKKVATSSDLFMSPVLPPKDSGISKVNQGVQTVSTGQIFISHVHFE